VNEAVALRGAARVAAMPGIVAGGLAPDVSRPLTPGLWAEGRSAARAGALLILELSGLWALSRLGYFLVAFLRVPLPGNVAGMLILFALLCSGAVPARLFERSSALLSRHLPFFFVPIAVGLMDLGATVLSEGWLLIVLLGASAAAGLCVTGWIAQWLSARKAQP
jgi:holin-like protein